jgi:hypothetical protein
MFSNYQFKEVIFMGKKLYLILAVSVVALLAVVPVIAGISGSGASGVQIQNLDPNNPVNVVVELWNQNGSAPIEVSQTGGDPIAAGTAKNYYLPTLPGVPDGAYAMAVSAGGPIAAIARTDWSATGGAALYGSVSPGTDVIIPLVVQDYAGQDSQFTIQNTNTAAAVNDVSIVLRGRGLASPVTTLSSQSIPAGTSVTYAMSDPVWGSLPDTALDLGASGFVGSVRITSATELVVQSFIDIPGSRGVTGFTGVSAADAANTLYCPLIRSNFFGDTGISIVNPGGSDVPVQITFYSDVLSPNSGTYTQDLTVPMNSSVIAFQGLGGNSRVDAGLPGGSQGPTPVPTDDGWFGVAKVVATGGDVQAVVNDTVFGGAWNIESQSTYNCVTASQAGSSFALPLLRKFHLSTVQLTTGIQLQNTSSSSSATVSLQLYDWDGTDRGASNPVDIVIPPNGSGNFWAGNFTGLPTVPADLGGFGWFGSGVITATGGDVVVVVDDTGFGATAIDSANYNGLLVP